MEERNEVLLKTIKTLFLKDDLKKVITLLNKIHPADSAEIIKHLKIEEKKEIFKHWRSSLTSQAFLEFSDEDQVELAENLEPSLLIPILEKMPADDAVDLLGNLEEEKLTEIGVLMKEPLANKLRNLLKHGKETAGGIMTPEYVSLNKGLTVQAAIETLRKKAPKEGSIYYIFVTNKEGQLVGVLSLRDLIVAEPKTLIKEIMNPEVIYAEAQADQEEIARLMKKYNLLALPIVSRDQELLGMVTIDDVVEVMEEEATEDIYRLSGTRDIPESDVIGGRLAALIRSRLPWLMVALVGEVLVVGFIADRFKGLLKFLPALAVYWAAMTSIGGNTSFQASTVAVRALSTGKLDPKTVTLRVYREARLGLVMSLVSGAILFLIAWLWQSLIPLAVIVGLANIAIVILGALTGALAPIIFDRLGIDPAVSSSPFLALLMDALSLLLYFSVAATILKIYHFI